jgi:hypothetical protein
MNDDRYLTAFLCLPSRRILGRKVFPFSLRHRLILETIGSPILKSGEEIRREDIVLALRVVETDGLNFDLKRATWRDKWLNLRLAQNPFLIRRGAIEFAAYLEDYTTGPAIWKSREGGGTDSGIHWTLGVVIGLMSMGFSEAEAWSMPEGRAIFYYTADQIRRGAEVQIMTTEEEEMLEKSKSIVDEFKRLKEEAARAPRRKPRSNGRN